MVTFPTYKVDLIIINSCMQIMNIVVQDVDEEFFEIKLGEWVDFLCFTSDALLFAAKSHLVHHRKVGLPVYFTFDRLTVLFPNVLRMVSLNSLISSTFILILN